MSYQSITIVGNLGRDPEMRYAPSGQAVCSFSVAVNRNYTDNSGQKVDETIWFRVSAWGKMAEVCAQYLKKGRQVLVEGRLTADPQTGGPRVYSRQDGTAGASFEISANTVRFLGGGNGNSADVSNDQDYEDVGDANPVATATVQPRPSGVVRPAASASISSPANGNVKPMANSQSVSRSQNRRQIGF